MKIWCYTVPFVLSFTNRVYNFTHCWELLTTLCSSHLRNYIVTSSEYYVGHILIVIPIYPTLEITPYMLQVPATQTQYTRLHFDELAENYIQTRGLGSTSHITWDHVITF